MHAMGTVRGNHVDIWYPKKTQKKWERKGGEQNMKLTHPLSTSFIIRNKSTRIWQARDGEKASQKTNGFSVVFLVTGNGKNSHHKQSLVL
jgi:hypothetical protein